MTAHRTLNLSLRELRLILERLVQAAGVPSGMLHAVRDCALYSAILPGPGLAAMAAQLDALRHSRPRPLTVSEAGGAIRIDGHGQHAWYAAHTALDLAIEAFRVTGEGAVEVRNVAEPSELRVAAGLAEAHGLSAALAENGDARRLIVSFRRDGDLKRIDQVRLEGMPTAAALWWPLYSASLEALAPDSFESRRHAGTVRVEADGRIVGRNDEDETDLTMLAPDPALLHYRNQ